MSICWLCKLMKHKHSVILTKTRCCESPSESFDTSTLSKPPETADWRTLERGLFMRSVQTCVSDVCLLCHTGYSPSFHPSSSKQPRISSPAEEHDSGLQEHRASPVLEVRTERGREEMPPLFVVFLMFLLYFKQLKLLKHMKDRTKYDI